MPKETRHAAGIIIWRQTSSGREYLVLRNAGHGTWGFPKGHREAGESDLACARRELAEETGLTDIELAQGFDESVSYEASYKDGVVFRKVVRYYLARLLSGEFVRSSEHDDATWASSDAAIEMLQHENARALVVAADNFLGLEAS